MRTKGHPGLKWEDCGCFEVPWCTPGRMWLMHRIRGGLKHGLGQGVGESVTYSSTLPPPPRPHHCPPFLLRSNGERAGGDAAGDHVV